MVLQEPEKLELQNFVLQGHMLTHGILSTLVMSLFILVLFFFSGGNYILELAFGVLIFFIFQYASIISLEEETLSQLFSKDYDEYKKNVPRVLPRLTKWENCDDRIPNSLKKTFFNEKRTLQNIFILISIITIKAYLTTS